MPSTLLVGLDLRPSITPPAIPAAIPATAEAIGKAAALKPEPFRLAAPPELEPREAEALVRVFRERDRVLAAEAPFELAPRPVPPRLRRAVAGLLAEAVGFFAFVDRPGDDGRDFAVAARRR